MNSATSHPANATSNELHGRQQSSRPHSRIKRWAACLFIAAYLTCLAHGVVCHALQFRPNAHPLMYFTVWDMFCGWSGWSSRNHILAEGESGQFYQLTPTPWGGYHPFSDLGREHYDSFRNHARQIGLNCLKQTRHEPITRMYLVEETWSKKFNLPDPLWSQLHDQAPDPYHYFHLDAVFTADGTLLNRDSSLHAKHQASWFAASLKGHDGPALHRVQFTSPLSN